MPLASLVLIAAAGLVAQLVDGGLGMGFGITSTTLLIMFAGLGPAQASAAVHAAELGTTVVSGLSHWRFGNVDWSVVLPLSLPGAVASFVGATFLSHLPLDRARPLTALVLAAIGLHLMWRFSRGQLERVVKDVPHTKVFLGGLGFFGGFVDATGGGGWGPITSSTLLAAGRIEPRRVVGTVTTAEFLVTLAATAGFVIGMWDELIPNLLMIAALLSGGVVAAPLAAWLVTKFNPVVLGGIVGTLIVFLNLPVALYASGAVAWVLRAIIVVAGIALGYKGFKNYRKRQPYSKTVAPS